MASMSMVLLFIKVWRGVAKMLESKLTCNVKAIEVLIINNNRIWRYHCPLLNDFSNFSYLHFGIIGANFGGYLWSYVLQPTASPHP